MNTRSKLLLLSVCVLVSATLCAQSLKVPDRVTAGTSISIPTSGSGEATLYLFGPAHVAKRKVQLGQSIELAGDDLRDAGHYTVVLKGGGADSSTSFFVTASKVDDVAFLARPSRVPASRPGVITGSAFTFDAYQNLELQPTPVTFTLSVEGAPEIKRTETTKNGVAWTRLDSGKKVGAAKFVASAGDASTTRVVQQVAADPCNIRMKAQRTNQGAIEVVTDPIRDCSGNAVPDGTIVTFTSVDASGKSTVDSRIKRGIARAELPSSNNALISVASGVVMGNEIHWGGKQ
jgi:hypothetical protein